MDVNQIQGYFIKFGSKEVSYEDAYMAFWFIYVMFFLLHTKIKRKPFQYAVALIFIATIGVSLQVAIPYSNPIICSDTVGSWDAYVAGTIYKEAVHINIFRVALIYLRLVTYSISAAIMKSIFDKNDYEFIYRGMVPWLKLPIIYGILECISKNLFDSGLTNSLNEILFGLGTSTFLFGEKRNHIYILQGFTREPSHYAFALFFSAVIMFANSRLVLNKKDRVINYVYIALCCVLMVLSGAFSSLIYICVLLSIFFILNQENIKRKVVNCRFFIIILIGILLFIGSFAIAQLDSLNIVTIRLASIYDNFEMMLNNTWHGNVGAYSEIIRFVSIIDTFKDVLNRPIFGLGCGIEWAHSGFVTMLSSIGFFGTFMWMKLSMYSREKQSYLFLMILLIVLPNLLCGFVDLLLSVGMIVLLELVNVINSKGVNNNERLKYNNSGL